MTTRTTTAAYRRSGTLCLGALLLSLMFRPSGLSAQTPELRVLHTYDTSSHVGRMIASNPVDYQDHPGILIDENYVTEIYPLLPYIFFDEGSASIPGRYHTLTDPSFTQSFTDSTVAGGMLEKYHHLLDIIGYRMRKHPDTRVEIQGYGSARENAPGEAGLGSRRGETVANYLSGIWQIDPSRISLKPGEEYPRERSNIKNPQGMEENRRVEIRSTDWEIARPILVREPRYRLYPEAARFRMGNGIDGALVASRRIEIRRGEQLWRTLEDIGTRDSITLPYPWSGGTQTLPPEDIPLSAQLVVTAANGTEYRSAPVSIPVEVMTFERKNRREMLDLGTEIYTFIGFVFDSPAPGLLNERILREYIYKSIRPGARIEVTGRSEVTGFGTGGRLSGRRAGTIADAIRKNNPATAIDTLISAGIGEADPIYSSELPEGRFYARSVQVLVETPSQRRRYR